MRKFPCGQYGKQRLEFHPAPFRAPLRAFASLVFPWKGCEVLVCNIEDRGWCIPSGRVEPDESSFDAAVREAKEEAGADLKEMHYIGCYRVTQRDEVRWVDVYTANVEGLTDLDPQFESIGRKFVTMEELPEIYHLWNPLTEAVFLQSKCVLDRHESMKGSYKRGEK
jgi:8-oxo-dGTP diphosphatase